MPDKNNINNNKSITDMVNQYDAGAIDGSEGLMAVRDDVSMYLGSSQVEGIIQMVHEVVENSVDEGREIHQAMPDYTVNIKIHMAPDGTVTVEDNGRGIPVANHPTRHVPTIYLALERVNFGGKRKRADGGGGSAYVGGSIGTHGAGLACTVAVSERFHCQVKRDGGIWEVEYNKGVRTTDLHQIGTCDPTDVGTKITFLYDTDIMDLYSNAEGEVDYPFIPKMFMERFRNYVLYSKATMIDFSWELPNGEKGHEFYDSNEYTLLSLLEESATYNATIAKVEWESASEPPFQVYTAAAVCDTTMERTAVNGLELESGSHRASLEDAIFETIQNRLKAEKVLNSQYPLYEYNVVSYYSYITELTIENPDFQGQKKLAYENARVYNTLKNYYLDLLRTGDWAEFMNELIVIVKERYETEILINEEVKNAKKTQLANINKTQVRSEGLEDDLVDCISNNKARTRLFMLEGKSARNPFVNNRNKDTDAVIPITGKALNIAKRSIDDARKSKRFRVLQNVIEKDKYGQYILAMDADEDGKHIQLLLLQIFMTFYPHIIEAGRLFVLVTPYYIAHVPGHGEVPLFSEDERTKLEKTYGNKIKYERFKGLGGLTTKEIKKYLIDTPILVKVTMDSNALAAQEMQDMMGRNADTRRNIVIDNFADESIRDHFDNKKATTDRHRIEFDYRDIEDGFFEDVSDLDNYIDNMEL